MMKPNFALDLSFEGITLLHDTGGVDWDVVGEVALDSANLAKDLALLRQSAQSLDPSGIATKLIIPEGQIRYLDIPAGSASHGDHAAAAAAALDGATPYALHDLAYDWKLSGERLQIAAVAQETLDEAEGFATEHGFNPVSFVARPEAGVFDGEPFFGPTARAEAEGFFSSDDAPLIAPAEPAPPEEPTSSAVKADEPSLDNDTAPPFSSVRAERGAVPQTAPKLDGMARFTPAPPLPDATLHALSVDAKASLEPIESELPATETTEAPDAPTLTTPPGTSLGSGAETKADSPPVVADDPGLKAAKVRGPMAMPAIPTPQNEAERLTIFGARKTEEAQRGKPRFFALILTAALVLLLIGVAALAAIFPDGGMGRLFRGSEPQIAVTPDIPELTVAEPEQRAPQMSPSPAPAQLPPRTTPETAPEIASLPEPIPAPGIDTRPVASAPAWQEPRTPEEARARYAATGIWPQAPAPPAEPPRDSLDGFYQTSIDNALAFGDAVALPDAGDLRADMRPRSSTPPPQPGQVFDLDGRGLVEATPDGTLSPTGVLVHSGPPPLRPETMPLRAVPVPGVEPTAEAMAARERLFGVRPRPRPENLTEQQERGALGGLSRIELAALRPRVRPSGLAPPVADSNAIDAALAEATDEAVAASLKPRLRPQSIARAVAARSSAPATAAEVEDDEPELTHTAAAAPRIPTSVSVAQQATSRNAINLRQVNLIGVYGSPANRRALVRLSNGRYQKVQVGDRIDGGRVSAIGDSELRYNKRGRDVVLRMPAG